MGDSDHSPKKTGSGTNWEVASIPSLLHSSIHTQTLSSCPSPSNAPIESRRGNLPLAREFHRFTAADADLTIFAALNAARVLDVLSSTCCATQSLLRLQAGQAIHGLPARRDEVPPALRLCPARPARPDSRSPCENSHLRALASRIGEIFGLVRIPPTPSLVQPDSS